MGNRLVLSLLLLVSLLGCAHSGGDGPRLGGDSCPRLLLLGDPHLPGENMERKLQLRTTINAWPDVTRIVVLGDICATSGTGAEYAAALEYLAGLQAPWRPITGNHDFVYDDTPDEAGRLLSAPLPLRAEKLETFRRTFSLQALSSSEVAGGYLLIFLSADSLEYLVGVRPETLDWLEEELRRHATRPTIIFFHAPLAGTLRQYKPWVNKPHTIAQPQERIHDMLTRHRQVILWVSGHTHTTPAEESYASAVNLYDGHVTNLHNAPLIGDTLWTNELRLCPDGVTVRTYDHAQQQWLPRLERKFSLP